MPLPSFPKECFDNVFLFLDESTVHNCLFINRQLCRLAIPIIWRDPFQSLVTKPSLINTLFASRNKEDEDKYLHSTLRSMEFNDPTPLFEYGKYIKVFNNERCVDTIKVWLKSLNLKVKKKTHKSILRKTINIIYCVIMRQGSELQRLIFSNPLSNYECIRETTSLGFITETRESMVRAINNTLPEISIFTTYKSGIANLKSLNLLIDEDHQKAIEFLSMVTKNCNGIIEFNLWIIIMDGVNIQPLSDFIMLQQLEKVSINLDVNGNVKGIVNALKTQSETLKELSFNGLEFQDINLSLISKLECLERLRIVGCENEHESFSQQRYDKGAFQLKGFELQLEHNELYSREGDDDFICSEKNSIAMKTMINSFCGEALLKLALNVVTLESVQAIKDFCPNVDYLKVLFHIEVSLANMIQLICQMPSLRILHIITADYMPGSIPDLLGTYLMFVKCLFLEMYLDDESLRNFTNDCKADLKKLAMLSNCVPDRLCCLELVNKYKETHESLEVLGIEMGGPNSEYNYDWTAEELEIINSLKNKGTDVVRFSCSYYHHKGGCCC